MTRTQDQFEAFTLQVRDGLDKVAVKASMLRVQLQQLMVENKTLKTNLIEVSQWAHPEPQRIPPKAITRARREQGRHQFKITIYNWI